MQLLLFLKRSELNKINQPMLENSRASNYRVFVGVLSKFPKLKTSVFRIADQRFIVQLVPEL